MDIKIISSPQGVSPVSLDTRTLAEISCNEKGRMFLDFGCGTGYIGIYAAKKGKRVVALDNSELAIKCAKENSKYNKVKIKFVKSDFYDNLKEKFDIIVFNPPLIPGSSNRYSVVRKIPLVKIILRNIAKILAKKDRMKLIRRFLEESKRYLNKNGVIILELAADKDEVLDLCKELGYKPGLIEKNNVSFARLIY